MAKRQNSDSLHHHRETFPGPDATASSDGLSGIHPVEQMVDAAIDRLAREAQRERSTVTTAAVLRDLTPVLQSQRSRGPSARSARLHWKGYDVSDEFRRYAERIASGEELPPFRGRVLQRPHPTFPWSPGRALQNARRGSALHVALWCSAGLVTLAIGWAVTQRVEAGANAANAAASLSLDRRLPKPVEATARLPRIAPVPDEALAPEEVEDPGEPAEEIEPAAIEASAIAPLEPSPPIVAAQPTPRPIPAAPTPAPAAVPAPAPTTAAATPPAEAAGQAAQAADPGLQALAQDLEELIPAGAPPAPVAAPVEAEGLEELLPPEPPAPNVRKKPSEEPSTNGALLIETPSF